jgi:hypothetical protein
MGTVRLAAELAATEVGAHFDNRLTERPCERSEATAGRLRYCGQGDRPFFVYCVAKGVLFARRAT